jgi:hypothetical protein
VPVNSPQLEFWEGVYRRLRRREARRNILPIQLSRAGAQGPRRGYFHIWGDDGTVSRQGCVIAQIDPTHYLVQFYEWFTGGASTLHIYTSEAPVVP